MHNICLHNPIALTTGIGMWLPFTTVSIKIVGHTDTHIPKVLEIVKDNIFSNLRKPCYGHGKRLNLTKKIFCFRGKKFNLVQHIYWFVCLISVCNVSFRIFMMNFFFHHWFFKIILDSYTYFSFKMSVIISSTT